MCVGGHEKWNCDLVGEAVSFARFKCTLYEQFSEDNADMNWSSNCILINSPKIDMLIMPVVTDVRLLTFYPEIININYVSCFHKL